MAIQKKVDMVLLVNLGSPDELSTVAIRKFLRVFLSDKRVVDLPRFLWYPILFGIILPLRSKKLLTKYQDIWLNDIDPQYLVGTASSLSCSPLVYYTAKQAHQLQSAIASDTLIVRYAFSYSTPDIATVLDEVYGRYCIASLRVIPLYPQYSSTTTAAVFDAIANYFKNKKYLPSIRLSNGFATNTLYIKALAAKIKQSHIKNGIAEKLIFSYHSLPYSLIAAGDSYYDECLATTRLIVEQLNLSELQYITTFQSKFGAQKWLSPATIDKVCEFGRQGIKTLDIICPGFVSDCLETLEEIAITNKQVFIHNGGINYNYINCLNDDLSFTHVLQELVKEL